MKDWVRSAGKNPGQRSCVQRLVKGYDGAPRNRSPMEYDLLDADIQIELALQQIETLSTQMEKKAVEDDALASSTARLKSES